VSRIVLVTGTDTGVGKTIVTAWLAVRAAEQGSVVVVKPVQTGIGPGVAGDADEIHRLTGGAVQEFTCLEDPLAPETAARMRSVAIPPVSEYADRIRVLAEFHETVLVEGAGGLLVRLDTEGGTLLDLAASLVETAADGVTVEVVVVARAGLGTLNHSELTVTALRECGIEPTGLVIGAWPAEPGLAETCNRVDLPRVTGVPLIGVIPEGAGRLDRDEFRSAVPSWQP
jgi:dethiobiotin synthetase